MRIYIFLLRKLLVSILTVLLLLLSVFVVLRLIPGGPAQMILGERATPEMIENLNHELGLDLPIPTQFIHYLGGILLRGDLGVSLQAKRPVSTMISEVYGTTIELALGGTIVGFLLGLCLGMIAALKRFTVIDNLIRGMSFITYSMPVFWLGLLLQLWFSVSLNLFPIGGRISATVDLPRITGILTIDSLLQLNFGAFVDVIKHLILPTACLGIWFFPLISRVTRAGVIAELQEDYVVTARAKGLNERVVITKHAFRNALLPVITITGLSFAGLLGGAVITETVFSLPGLGRLLISALLSRDFPVVQGIVTIFCVVVITINMVIDILYGIVDPRIRV